MSEFSFGRVHRIQSQVQIKFGGNADGTERIGDFRFCWESGNGKLNEGEDFRT